MNTNELKQRIPIEEEIGRYVALTRQGRHYTGLCPFTTTITRHWLSTPSGAPSAALPAENGAT